jgi:hypothetical protein
MHLLVNLKIFRLVLGVMYYCVNLFNIYLFLLFASYPARYFYKSFAVFFFKQSFAVFIISIFYFFMFFPKYKFQPEKIFIW